MSSQKLVWRLLAAIALVAILAGCSAAPVVVTATPVTATTAAVDLQPTFNAIKTQAVQTLVANMTQSAPSATPVTPTNTALPSATPLPTNTPVPPAPPTATFIPWTLTPTQGPYSCTITTVTPKASDSFTTGANIDGIWVVKNTGTKTWLKSETDARYSSGTKFQKNGDIVDLTANVAPGESYTVGVDMLTPTSTGTYTATWVIITGKITICTLPLTVVVK